MIESTTTMYQFTFTFFTCTNLGENGISFLMKKNEIDLYKMNSSQDIIIGVRSESSIHTSVGNEIIK